MSKQMLGAGLIRRGQITFKGPAAEAVVSEVDALMRRIQILNDARLKALRYAEDFDSALKATYAFLNNVEHAETRDQLRWLLDLNVSRNRDLKEALKVTVGE